MLIFVRHGQTPRNVAGVLLGRSDSPLTDLGLVQAREVAAQAALSSGTRVICSPLKRARQTADALGLPVEVDERWIELDYGAWEGVAVGDLSEADRRAFRADPSWAPPDGESLEQVYKRVHPACEELFANAAAHDVVVVSHVTPIKAAVAWALGVPVEVAWRMHLDLAAVCRVTSGPSGPLLVSYNDVSSHADEPVRSGGWSGSR